ncbi:MULTISPECIES: TlpA disulfide reductase family protein [Bacteroides]|uniref:TlpA disulfide reductase family protein n=1 Tax=Bacteroides TaxID=816 RepID=UPI001F41498B|nr:MULTISPECIES: TlpA disulfide reductase family protein [Bacteroides]MCF2736721.1 redoxin domain-containing protein [Bacteroides caecigallinarum]MCR8893331.1 AhpC/TSA family protein [Bacteroides sp. ET336]MDN0057828.1 TlpA disulfide reductase family protein [Bacteroides caecigallinarum]MDN0072206.1 TlpA disulfide reductase family protein [Bacteroides caecigallinarum]
MSKKSYIAAVLISAGFAACNRGPVFNVEGEISGAEGKMLYIEHSSIEGVVGLDSTKLSGDGRYHFSEARPEAPDFYRLRVDDRIINFVVDSTETVNISSDYNTFSSGYSVTGSESNVKIKELSLLQADLQAKVNELNKSGMPAGLAQDSLFRMIESYKNDVKRNYIYKEPDKASSYFALFQQLNGFMIFNPLSNKEDVKCFAAVATSLNHNYPHADRSRNLYNMVIKGMKNTRTPQTKTLEISEDMINETSIIDIPLKDINGETKHLTDYKGKVVLIDFTAYGTPSSGARTLALRELYNKYSSQGLVIYQVSLDTDEHFWKTACDNLPWVCVRDPQGPYSTYVNIYGVTALPTAFLVNKNNELVLRLNEKSDIEAEIKKLL